MYMQPNSLVELCDRAGGLKTTMDAFPRAKSPATYTFLRRKSP
jgi:hypothetical protein